MKATRMKQALESIARRGIPDDIDLRSQITSKLERKTFMMSLRARPVLAVLIALLGILLLGGVAYALSRSLGYVPGYGVLDQNVQMRVLSEPISQTRDGITITIDEMLLTSDTLFMKSTMENIPNNLMLPMTDTTTVTCQGAWVYQLPDGSQLSFDRDHGHGTMEPFAGKNVDLFSYHGSSSSRMSTPLDVNKVTEMTLRIPCVTGDVPAGALPENWEFHLRFVPAPAGMLAMTAFPVIEYTPAPAPTIPAATPAVETNISATPSLNPISITKVIDTGDSYILIGEFMPPAGLVTSNCCAITLQDANGQEGFDVIPADIELGTPTANTPGAFAWVRQFEKQGVVLPLTIKFVDLETKTVSSAPFEFDAGEDPGLGDEWQINQPFDVSGVPFMLEKISVRGPQIPSSAGGYIFSFTYPADNDIAGIQDIVIDGYPLSINSGFSGGGSSDPAVTPVPGINFSTEFPSLPKGKLIIRVIFYVVDGERTWTLPWQP